MTDPTQLTPRQAWEAYVDSRQTDTTEQSQDTYHYRLKLWVEWCEEEGIETVSSLSGWTLEQYRSHRSGEGIAASTLSGEMQTLKNFIEYLERIEAVDDALAEKVKVPNIPQKKQSDDTRLTTEAAERLIEFYRNSDLHYGSRAHALVELIWHTGARLGSVRSLDVCDYNSDEKYIEFVHRPDQGTPLKNKVNGERYVSLRDSVCDALDEYIESNRWDRYDDHGRQPLFSSSRGRPGRNTVRTWIYKATVPCLHSDCPHGRERQSCKAARVQCHASKCPSSRSPHQVRTGSITWHRNRAVPKKVTRKRVNASEKVIDRHYDKASKRDRMELRRRPHLDKLALGD
nr:tyrosine-type recombinase/integrase [Halostella litorea]